MKHKARAEWEAQMQKLMTPKQRALIRKHGTPASFAIACYLCVPEISMDEAEKAAQAYRQEFQEAGDTKNQ